MRRFRLKVNLFSTPSRDVQGRDVMSYISPPPVSADLDGYNRPCYDRQRSYSAPEFRVFDVTAAEAVMICSAAASASDRRRRRRNRNYASLDVDLEGTMARTTPPTESETIMEEQELEYEPVFDSEPEQEPELEPSVEDEPPTPGSALSTYANTMAGFMQQQILAIRQKNLPRLDTRLDTSTHWVHPMLSIPDDQLCSSPPIEYEEKEVMEITPSDEPSFDFLRPQLQSTFSAWSSVAPSPVSPNPPTAINSAVEVTSYFNFPEPPKSARIDSVSSSYLQSTLSKLEAQLIENEPERQIETPPSHTTPTVKRPNSAKSMKANKRRTTNDHVFLTNYDVDKQPTPPSSPPTRNCGQSFPHESKSQQTRPATPYQTPIHSIRHVY